MGFTEPTPIQNEVIPYMLEGKDCLAQAPTGTGKTCAFGIPLANMIDAEDESVQALIMCPTRELAMQTEKEIKKLISNFRGIKVLAIYGGQNFSRQLASLRKKPQVIVGTPGRVLDHLSRHTLKFDNVKMLVLDEADEMLNMGFREDIDEILKNIKGKAQTVLFSATMSKEILDISRNYQNEPVTVKTTLNKSDLPVIKQYFVKLKESDKTEALKKIMDDKDYHFVLCFCNTKRRVDDLTEKLNANGILASGLHGDLRQRQRDIIMQSYRSRQINILVATDVAARGIDVSDVEAVFNYDMPLDDEYYIHRIGRTARANKTGESYSFATAKDLHRVKECERYTKSPIEELSLSGLSDITLTTKKQKFSDTPTVRFFLNLGGKDGLDDKKITELITTSTKIKEKEILEIKILDLFSFLEIDQAASEELFALNGEKYNKRVISVEKAEAANKSRGRKPSLSSSRTGERKFSSRSDDRKSNFSRSDDRKSSYSRSDDKKPSFPRSDDKKSSFTRSDDRKSSYSNSDDRKPSFPRSDDRKSSFSRSDDKKSSFPRSDDRKSSYSRSDDKRSNSDGEKRSYAKPDGERKSYSRAGTAQKDTGFKKEDEFRKSKTNKFGFSKKPLARKPAKSKA